MFYSGHGVIAGLTVALNIGAAIVLIGGRKARQVHRLISFFAFVLYAGVMMIGLVMAWGT